MLPKLNLRLPLLTAALLSGALAAGCNATAAPDGEGEDAGDSESGAASTVASAVSNSCATSSVKGLSKQIIAEVRCMNEEAYAAVPALGNVSFGSSVFAYMEKPARDRLVSALKSKSGTTMTINSMLRTVAQQYLLYRWYQNGSCGISLAAKPGASNHETGLAIDVSQYSTWKGTLQANGFQWLGSSDPVHFDYAGAGAVSYKGMDVKAFQRLWNRNHADDKIDADGVWGPQTEARMKKSPAGGFAKGATCASAQSLDDEDFELIAGAEADERFAAGVDVTGELEDIESDEAHAHLADGAGEVCVSAAPVEAAADDACSTCFETICQNDSYCCEVEWDESCVATGMAICEVLCGKEATQPL